MGDFRHSNWADESFADNYLEKADVFIPERNKMFELLASIYKHLNGDRKGLSVCDLGCGDGAATKALLQHDDSICATLVDASESMLDKAKVNLSQYNSPTFIRGSFENLLDGKVDTGKHNTFISAQAIHHLTLKEKSSLFGLIFSRLRSPGLFINIDVVLPPSGEIEELYFNFWSEGMRKMADIADMDEFDPLDVIKQYKSPESSNRPDTLHDQLDALRASGFTNVDCYYKNGIFAVFGGQKG